MTRRVGGFLLTVGGMSWYCVAPGAGVSITGQVVIAASCIWFARKGGRLPLPAPVPRRPLSPQDDAPALVVSAR